MVAVATVASAQGNQTVFRVHGTVFEQTGSGVQTPLQYAVITLKSYGMHTSSDLDGSFELRGVPAGQVALQVQLLGKVTIDTLINVTSDLNLTLYMRDDNFRLKDVVVTAEVSKAGQSTASFISRAAMDHLQATSLTDIMSLLPGNLVGTQDLSFTGKINIRSVGSGSAATNGQDMNALGVLILQDGAPLSNNANLNNTGSTTIGSTTSIRGIGPLSGVDARTVSTDNIESIEVIQGVASVEYGDVTSGVVVIKTKAGREPLRIFSRLNPKVYMFSASAGYQLGEKAGVINFNADYAHNFLNLITQYTTYNRTTAKFTYSNSLLNNRWTTNTSLSFLNGVDRTRQNPDDLRTNSRSAGDDNGITLNTNGTFVTPNMGWLRNINYTLSGTYTLRNSFSESDRTTTGYSYSGTTTDGAVLSNRPGVDLYDVNGNKITNFGTEDAANYAFYARAPFLGRQDINGKELNLFAKVVATLSKKVGSVNNRILIGAEFTHESNMGDGISFPYENPIPSPLAAQNPYAAYRSRAFKDVPGINAAAIYAEENFDLAFGGERHLKVQAGLRYDQVSVAGGLAQPRMNASLDLFPWLAVKGGWGIFAKKPSLLHLYPQNAYFELMNLNTIDLYQDDPAKQYYISTTRVFDAQNKNIEIAKKEKSELGLDLRYKQFMASITYFRERMDNGYKLGTTFDTYRHVTHKTYQYDPVTDKISEREDFDVLVRYYTPTNNVVDHTNGVEYTVNLPRINAIRTTFNINGAWMRTETYDKGHVFYSRSTGMSSSNRGMGVYEKAMEKYNFERHVTSLRVIHNIPELGFVVSLTAQVTWKESNWYRYGNDSIPVMYISRTDGKVYDFPYTNVNEVPAGSEYANMLRSVNQDNYLTESKPPLFCFNINVTKEIGNFMRVSLFANNMFRSYPVYQVKRSATSGSNFQLRNEDLFFFGMELSLTIK